MTAQLQPSGRLICAARALAGVSQADFAVASGIPVKSLRLIEGSGSAWVRSESDVAALHRGLAYFGIVLVAEADGMGEGVRLKFTRQDVRQIVRFEGEGGTVGFDDAP